MNTNPSVVLQVAPLSHWKKYELGTLRGDNLESYYLQN